MHYLYLIVSNKAVKIGISGNPSKRLSDLQNSNYETLQLYFTFSCETPELSTVLERKLHRRYSHLNIRGEWFSIDPEIAINDVLSRAEFRNLTCNYERYMRPVITDKEWRVSPAEEKTMVSTAAITAIILSILTSLLFTGIDVPTLPFISLFVADFLFLLMCFSIFVRVIYRALGD